jgi:arylsulfatase A-like enzyme
MKSLKDYNIVLINIDGFRKDKIDLCTSFKTLKDNSIYFSNMYTASPYTFAAVHAIFSGMYPSRNGVNAYYNMFKFKKDSITTLPQLLQKSGYYTCCDIISESVMPRQGIDEWNLFDEATIDFKQRHKKLLEKLSKKKKFFVFLHYTETHKHLVREIVSKYKQEDNDDEFFQSQNENNQRFNSYLPSCDEYVSTILDTLKESGIYDNTIVIFFTDHGTSIGEKKGEKFYGVYTYDYTIGVFSILHIPGIEAKTVNEQCRTLDLFPTIAELAEIPLGKDFDELQGKSLLELIENPSNEEREVFVETGGLYGPWPSARKHNVFCIRSNQKKLIYNDTPKTWELYDLEKDPKEINNIYEENLLIVQDLKKRLIWNLNDNNIVTKIS